MRELLGLAVLAWPLTLIVLILLALVVVIWIAVVFAARTGRSKWRWALIGFLAVYLLIFWDWIPTVVVHKYYCATQAGFWVYKTVDQWKKENPWVAETLTPRKAGDRLTVSVLPDGERMMLNQRIAWDRHTTQVLPLLSTSKDEYLFIDIKTGEILARRVTIGSGYGNPLVSGKNGWKDFKFWLAQAPCWTNKAEVSLFSSEIENIGRQ